MLNKPLADYLRPESFDEVVGQSHLLGEGKILSNLIKNQHLPNLIFYGPSGVGKTTVVQLISSQIRKPLYQLNATTCGVSDIKEIIAKLDTLEGSQGIVLYLDEIHNFNKKQQQSLLKYVENGQITLIASTTENPYFTIFGALLSRSTILEFKPLAVEDIQQALRRGVSVIQELLHRQINVSDEALSYLATLSNGDLRQALNSLELMIFSASTQEDLTLTLEEAKQSTFTTGFSYDREGDQHYDVLSAFQKSIRGSDANAAVHYLARLVKAGDLNSICRRLIVIAAEDIGLAYPQAVSIVKGCTDAAFQLGFPEARIPLAQATIFLANCPKSNSAYLAIKHALADLDQGKIGVIPPYLKDAHYQGAKQLGHTGYLYPHDFQHHYVSQQYLPDLLKDRHYYVPAPNKMEQQTQAYLEWLKNQS